MRARACSKSALENERIRRVYRGAKCGGATRGSGLRLGLEHADLDEDAGEVVDAALLGDVAVGEREHAGDRHVDVTAGRSEAEELARVRSREPQDLNGAIAVDQ